MNPSHNQIVAYLQNLATNNIHVNDFFRFNLNEIQGAMRKGISFPCLAIESHDGNFEGSTHNNSIEQKRFAFSILDKPKRGDFDDENTKLDACEIIGKEFLKRMRLDSLTDGSTIYKAFNIENVSYHKVGPLYNEHLYGYRFEVPLNAIKVNMQPNADNWSDINSICP